MEDFNANVGKMADGKPVGQSWHWVMKLKRKTLLDFPKSKFLMIMNTTFDKKAYCQKWIQKLPSRERSEIDFTFKNTSDIRETATVLKRIYVSNNTEWLETRAIWIWKGRNNLITLTNLLTFQKRKPDYAVIIENRYSAFNDESNVDTEEMNKNFTKT